MTLNEEIIMMCAFRYALGRMTYVVGAYVEQFHLKWKELPADMKALVVQEIKDYRLRDTKGKAGMDMDDREWQTIIDRYENESEGTARQIK